MLNSVKVDKICLSCKKEDAHLLQVVWDLSSVHQLILFSLECKQMAHFQLSREEATKASSMLPEEFQLKKVSRVFGKVVYQPW